MQQAKIKSHSIEHRTQEQPLLQPKQVKLKEEPGILICVHTTSAIDSSQIWGDKLAGI